MAIQHRVHTILLTFTLAASLPAFAAPAGDRQMIERGRYVVHISGCNDCHTPGYMENAGNIKTEHGLTGTALGWQGPWGTTYPTNLRLLANTLSESQWLTQARRETRPPMPWFALRAVSALRSASRRCSRISRASRLSQTSGSRRPVSRRSALLMNSLRPSSRCSLSSFQRMAPAMPLS